MAKQTKLKAKMFEIGISGKDLAEQTGILPQHMSSILNGKSNGSVKWWVKAAEVLKCTVSDIMEV